MAQGYRRSASWRKVARWLSLAGGRLRRTVDVAAGRDPPRTILMPLCWWLAKGVIPLFCVCLLLLSERQRARTHGPVQTSHSEHRGTRKELSCSYPKAYEASQSKDRSLPDERPRTYMSQYRSISRSSPDAAPIAFDVTVTRQSSRRGRPKVASLGLRGPSLSNVNGAWLPPPRGYFVLPWLPS